MHQMTGCSQENNGLLFLVAKKKKSGALSGGTSA